MSEPTLIDHRIQLLRRGLETVQRLLEDMKVSRGPLELQRAVLDDEELRNLFYQLDALANQIRELVRPNSDIFDRILPSAQAIETTASSIRRLLRDRWAAIDAPLGLRMISMDDLRAGIEAGLLRKQTTALLGDLDDLASELRRAAPGTDSRAPDAEDARSPWQKLARIGAGSDAVFREYFELLSGLALRETGLDSGLCRIADKLMKDWEDPDFWPWTSWTVPARDEAPEATFSRILRIGFPEWTLWALPLAGHEFGKVALGETRLATVANEHRGTPGSLTLLADIFATYVGGPAYACALLYMRLSPPAALPSGQPNGAAPHAGPGQEPSMHAQPGAPNDRALLSLQRVHVTLRTLEMLDDVDWSGGQPTANVRGILAKYWNDALEQAGTTSTLADETALNELVETMAAKIGSTVRFPIQHWPEIEGWAKRLANGEGSEIEPGQDHDEVRMAINAAWIARLTSPRARLEDLEAAGRALAEKMIDLASTSSSPKAGPMTASKTAGANVGASPTASGVGGAFEASRR
jgi:hypothetical protein